MMDYIWYVTYFYVYVLADLSNQAGEIDSLHHASLMGGRAADLRVIFTLSTTNNASLSFC